MTQSRVLINSTILVLMNMFQFTTFEEWFMQEKETEGLEVISIRDKGRGVYNHDKEF